MSTAREQILATTCELLEVQGFHATGLNEIISRSGSPKGSLYYYFPGGKEALTAEAVTQVGRVVEARIREQLAGAAAAEGVRAFIRQIAQQVQVSGYRAGGPITTIALETASSSERLRAVCDAIYASWIAAFRDHLQAAGLAGDDARALATVIVAAIEGGIILARSGQSPAPLDHVAEAMGDLVSFTLTERQG